MHTGYPWHAYTAYPGHAYHKLSNKALEPNHLISHNTWIAKIRVLA